MPPKRTAEPSSGEKIAEKMRKLNAAGENDPVSAIEEELERIKLHQINLENARALYLAQQYINMPNLSPISAMSILKFCINVKSEYVVRQFFRNHTINLKTPEGCELLWLAIENAEIEIASMLVRSGVDLSVREAKGNSTFLHEVLKSSKIKDSREKIELVWSMLGHGADVNACDSEGYSVLHEALGHDRCSSELIEVLLQHGANVKINEKIHLDDIFQASLYKPKLLPRLIEHQVPDEKTRNQRAFIAIDNLILQCKDYSGPMLINTLNLLKRILDMGVYVNTANPFPGERPHTLLCTALLSKKKVAIKLLLDYGADPHQPNYLGHTPLYQATAFVANTNFSRWLIEKGASIHTPNNDSYGWYPIHGAYQHLSLKNIHLLISLGADINVTDKKGFTPFQYSKDICHFKDHHRLFIKHFALIISKGGKICHHDNKFARKYYKCSHHFDKCLKQLQQMKNEYIYAKVPYFSLLSENMYSLLQLMKNPDFARNFKKNETKRNTLFPRYTHMLLHNFEIAEIRYNMLRRQENQIREAADHIFPGLIIEKIALYSCIEQLERCQYEYFMNFHANLKYSKADKEQIV